MRQELLLPLRRELLLPLVETARWRRTRPTRRWSGWPAKSLRRPCHRHCRRGLSSRCSPGCCRRATGCSRDCSHHHCRHRACRLRLQGCYCQHHHHRHPCPPVGCVFLLPLPTLNLTALTAVMNPAMISWLPRPQGRRPRLVCCTRAGASTPSTHAPDSRLHPAGRWLRCRCCCVMLGPVLVGTRPQLPKLAYPGHLQSRMTGFEQSGYGW